MAARQVSYWLKLRK